jgi:hypothetical protein
VTDDDRHVRKQEVTAMAMDAIKKAVEDAGENNGAPSNLHIFTQVPCLALSLCAAYDASYHTCVRRTTRRERRNADRHSVSIKTSHAVG